SAPYFHDGASGTLQEAILRHDGDAIAVTTAFKNLPPADQQSLVAFLMTLRAPADAQPSQALLASNAVAANK
ncbi:MAG TPA: di-heme oxidoredictase family protein, partial [Pirellulaceae bacterium]|nr:di-heme oxidoredictase family protein [Pirellulaceae bacterium]